MAALPSSVEDISTNAKPRERPVSRSSITFTDSTVPACENNSCKSSRDVWNERLPTYSFIDILCVPFLLSGVRREALNQVCFDETERAKKRAFECSMEQLLRILMTNLPSNHPNAELSFSAGASPFMRESRSNRRLSCICYQLALQITLSIVSPLQRFDGM